MKILNLYFSSTGNTDKVAKRITETVQQLGHEIDTIKIAGDQDLDLLGRNFLSTPNMIRYLRFGLPS